MATWGKLTATINKYEPASTMYYEYNTTSDIFYIKSIVNEDFGLGNECFENESRFSPDYAKCLMEALINHFLAFEYSGDIEEFMNERIINNRFKKAEK